MGNVSWLQEVLVGPENRTVLSNDNFLRVNLIGDFVGYTSLPSFEDFYLVIPRQVCRNVDIPLPDYVTKDDRFFFFF